MTKKTMYTYYDAFGPHELTEEELMRQFYFSSVSTQPFHEIVDDIKRRGYGKIDSQTFYYTGETEEDEPAGGCMADFDEYITGTKKDECDHEGKYLNTVSRNLSFMFCPKCRKEVT
jgi:hypothetical protein